MSCKQIYPFKLIRGDTWSKKFRLQQIVKIVDPASGEINESRIPQDLTNKRLTLEFLSENRLRLILLDSDATSIVVAPLLGEFTAFLTIAQINALTEQTGDWILGISDLNETTTLQRGKFIVE